MLYQLSYSRAALEASRNRCVDRGDVGVCGHQVVVFETPPDQVVELVDIRVAVDVRDSARLQVEIVFQPEVERAAPWTLNGRVCLRSSQDLRSAHIGFSDRCLADYALGRVAVASGALTPTSR